MLTLISSCLWVLVSAGSALGSLPRPAQAAAIPALFDRYASGEHDAAVVALASRADLRKLLRDFDRDGRAWIDAGGPALSGGRRFVAASAALEVAGRRHADWADARELVEWACGVLAEAPPQPAERLWHLAALVLIQGAGDSVFLLGPGRGRHPEYLPVPGKAGRAGSPAHYDHATSRFPDDASLQLAGVIAEELASSPGLRQGSADDRLIDIVRRLEPLLSDKAVGAEARVRTGYTYLRLSKPDLALAHLREVPKLTNDPFLIYLTRYLAGRAQEAHGNRTAAIAAYRDALDVVPAQSAAFALAGLLFVTDQRDEAFASIEATLALKTPPVDPWRAYGAGDLHRWPGLIEQLRRELK